jgi:HAD superfamily phosphatase (TIGR01668 family)
MKAAEIFMKNILQPDFQYESLQSIKAQDLLAAGIRGLLLDLDNTITPWNDRSLTQGVKDWFQEIKEHDIKACIVSNNRRPERVSAVADVLGIFCVYQAAKPRKKAFLKGLRTLGLDKSEVAVVGDQIFTDVLGGNRLGIKTILITPIDEREFAGTKILRLLERLVGRKPGYIRSLARQTVCRQDYYEK